MNKNDLRTCCVCHTQYSYCPVCNPEDRNKPTFYFAYCSENCRDIYSVTSAYEDGLMSDIEAKKELEKLNLSNKDNFGESYKKSIASIMKAKTQVVKKEKIKTDVKSVNKNIITKGEENTESNVE
jgi:hypothetical protein